MRIAGASNEAAIATADIWADHPDVPAKSGSIFVPSSVVKAVYDAFL